MTVTRSESPFSAAFSLAIAASAGCSQEYRIDRGAITLFGLPQFDTTTKQAIGPDRRFFDFAGLRQNPVCGIKVMVADQQAPGYCTSGPFQDARMGIEHERLDLLVGKQRR
jgi:hypothetical protein